MWTESLRNVLFELYRWETAFLCAPVALLCWDESLMDFRIVWIQVSRPTEITAYQRETPNINRRFIPSMERLLSDSLLL